MQQLHNVLCGAFAQLKIDQVSRRTITIEIISNVYLNMVNLHITSPQWLLATIEGSVEEDE